MGQGWGSRGATACNLNNSPLLPCHTPTGGGRPGAPATPPRCRVSVPGKGVATWSSPLRRLYSRRPSLRPGLQPPQLGSLWFDFGDILLAVPLMSPVPIDSGRQYHHPAKGLRVGHNTQASQGSFHLYITRGGPEGMSMDASMDASISIDRLK